MTKLTDMFTITPEEQARLDAAPFRGADEASWRTFAGGIHEGLLGAYASGDITLERALTVMWSCSLGCRAIDRVALMALTGRRAIQGPVPVRKGRRSPNPEWVKRSAANLVQMLREDRPDEPLAPTEHNGWETPILKDAIRWLVALGICTPVSPRTLYQWYRDSLKDQSKST